MSTIKQEGAENPELSLESQRRAMLRNAVITGQNSLFAYFGYDTLDAEGLQERGVAYAQPHMPAAPVVPMQHVVMAPQPAMPMQPAQHIERPIAPVAERPVMPERPVEHSQQPNRPMTAQFAPTPTPAANLTPALNAEIPAQESTHMIDARAKVEAAFAEMQLEAQQPTQPNEQPMMSREGYDLAA